MAEAPEDLTSSLHSLRWDAGPADRFKPSYDRRRDILFIQEEPNRPAVSRDIAGEVLIRFNPDTDEIVGVEINDFRKLFLVRHPELAIGWEKVTKHRGAGQDAWLGFLRSLLTTLRDWQRVEELSPGTERARERARGGAFYNAYFQGVREFGQREVDRRLREGDARRLERLKALPRSHVDWTAPSSTERLQLDASTESPRSGTSLVDMLAQGLRALFQPRWPAVAQAGGNPDEPIVLEEVPPGLQAEIRWPRAGVRRVVQIVLTIKEWQESGLDRAQPLKVHVRIATPPTETGPWASWVVGGDWSRELAPGQRQAVVPLTRPSATMDQQQRLVRALIEGIQVGLEQDSPTR